VRTNTVYEIIGHPGGSTLDAQGQSRVIDMDYLSQLSLKNVTLINGRADDGGAIRMRSRMPVDVELTIETMTMAEATRLTFRGGAIRNCEATNDGGAIATTLTETIFGGAAGIHRRWPVSLRPSLMAHVRRPRTARVAPAPACKVTTLSFHHHRSRHELA
tara:strand:- start:102 stop:581 length:480 start_codon:yes stop_codon:yes gene_type:complete